MVHCITGSREIDGDHHSHLLFFHGPENVIVHPDEAGLCAVVFPLS